MLKNKYPKISIVTPALNQVDFIERTVRSVLEQGYPNLEYIVVDGGSTDGTLDILRDYRSKLILISEKDKGQTSAINKGLRIATGEIVAYLNSDDLYLKDSLFKVAKAFIDKPEALWISGRCKIIDGEDKEIRQGITSYKNFWLNHYNYFVLLVLNFISQPATFWKSQVIKELDYLDESLYYVMDYEYWLRIGKKYKPYILKDYLAGFRIQRKSKSILGFQKEFLEEYNVARRYTKSNLTLFLHRLHYYLLIFGPYSLFSLLKT